MDKGGDRESLEFLDPQSGTLVLDCEVGMRMRVAVRKTVPRKVNVPVQVGAATDRVGDDEQEGHDDRVDLVPYLPVDSAHLVELTFMRLVRTRILTKVEQVLVKALQVSYRQEKAVIVIVPGFSSVIECNQLTQEQDAVVVVAVVSLTRVTNTLFVTMGTAFTSVGQGCHQMQMYRLPKERKAMAINVSSLS